MTIASLKELRGYVRSEAAKADAWKYLEATLGDVADIDKTLTGLRGQIAELTDARAKAEAAKVAVEASNAELVAKAEAKAKEIVTHAEGVKADAERRSASTDAIVADAQAEAARIVDEGRVAGNALANELDGRLAAVRADIAEAEKTRTKLANDVAALEKRAQAAKAELKRFIAEASEAVA